MKYFFSTIIATFLFAFSAKSQKPFECGAMYFTVGNNGGTDIYKVLLNSDKSLSTSLYVRAEADFNGVGYRRQDNLMYAVIDRPNANGTYNFFQIDAAGKVKILRQLPLDTQHSYYAGDVTVDGKYYVLLSNGKSPNKIYLIDLESPTYELKETTLTVGTDISSPDIAFSPEGDRLYAYDTNAKQLIEIDWKLATVTNRFNNKGPNNSFNGMWSFDCALYGYSRNVNGFVRAELEAKTIDKGTVSEVGKFLPQNLSSIDGCSCPPPLRFYKSVERTINPDTCITEFKYRFIIENDCGITQTNVTFEDIMPEEFTITKINKNPYGGTVKGGVGTNKFSLENITIPNKKDTIIITTRLRPKLDKSIFKNQAILKNIRWADGAPFNLPSDDLSTPAFQDSTTVKAPLVVNFSKDTISVCPNGEAVLKPKIEGVNLSFIWNTGEKTNPITVKKEGIYSVTVTSDCEIAIDTQVVVNRPITLEIGENKNILPGDSVFIFPSTGGYNPIDFWNWVESKGANLKDKKSKTNLAKPNQEEVSISLQIIDSQGCTVSDNLLIKMQRNTYIPNVFSPNEDAKNDRFYIHTEAKATVNLLQIFDRWGNLIFENTACPSNDPACGWDGNYKSQIANMGVYTYRAVVLFGDNVSVNYKGDVMLIR